MKHQRGWLAMHAHVFECNSHTSQNLKSKRLWMLNKPLQAQKIHIFDNCFLCIRVGPPLSSIYARGVQTDPPAPVGIGLTQAAHQALVTK
jgi:hypothetical protein